MSADRPAPPSTTDRPHAAEGHGRSQGTPNRAAHGGGRGGAATPSKARSASGIAQIAMAVLFVLAVLATIVMVFSDNDLWMRIGLLAALWSALVGALLVARDRRVAQQAAERETELKRVYSLELESEVAARRERELSLREELREEVRAENDESIDALRVEVMALRSQLEQLGVQPMVDGGRAVAAEHRHALGAGDSSPDERHRDPAAHLAEAAASRRPEDGASSGAGSSSLPASFSPAGPGGRATSRYAEDDTPSTEVTSAMPKVRDTAHPAAAPAASAAPSASVAPPTPGPDRVSRHATPDGIPRQAASPAVPFGGVEQAEPFSRHGVREVEPAEHAEPAESAEPADSAVRPAFATGPGTDRFRSFESFRLSAPPSFTDDAELPDFDAPTGFEPGVAGFGARPAGIPAGAPAADEDAGAGRHSGRSPAAAEYPASAPSAEPRPGRRRKPDPEDESPAPAQAPTPAPDAWAASWPDGSEDTPHIAHHDSGAGTSVADLLARLGGGDSTPSAGGRRRRAD